MTTTRQPCPACLTARWIYRKGHDPVRCETCLSRGTVPIYLNMLGKASDYAIGQRYGVSASEVGNARRGRNIPPFPSQRAVTRARTVAERANT